MDLPRNAFKAALRAGLPQIGIWCSIPEAGHAEALACCGFDWILFDCEHTPVPLTTVQAMLMAVAPYPTQAIVRPGSGDPVEIKRILDLGALTLLVPNVQDADEAARAVAAMRYAPQGMRGVAGLTRASRYGMVPNYTAQANAEICLLVQAESAQALTQIEAIAAVEGVDGIFIGPADLAASMGFPGQPSHPEVKAAILDAIARIRSAGKPAGILTLDPDFLPQAVAAGVQFPAVDVDAAIVLRGAREAARKWKAATRGV